MKTLFKWRVRVCCIFVWLMLISHVQAVATCLGESGVVGEYLFSEGSGNTAFNTGIDGENGNATLLNGAAFDAVTPPSNMGCGWSINLPASGTGSATPFVEATSEYDPLAGASNFTILAWVRRQSSSASSNMSARIVSDVNSLALTGTTAGVEFRFAGAAGTLALRLNGNEVGTTAAGVAPDSDEWCHVAVVYDGARPATNMLTRNVHFYINGIQRGDGNVLQGVMVGSNTNLLTLGNSSVGRGIVNLLVGLLDDVIILYGVAPAAVGNGKTNETIQCYMNLNDDIETPQIQPPADITLDAGKCLAGVSQIDLGWPTVSDNCTISAVFPRGIPAVFPVGTTSVIWHVFDGAGNHSEGEQQVTVLPSRALDCDGDGLTDYEEVMTYMTDPKNPCTAGDGLSDGWKVQFGFDPAMPVPADCRPKTW